MDIESALKKSELLRGITEINEILKCLDVKIKKFGEGELIVQEGDSVGFFGIVIEGGVQIAKETAEGNRIIIGNVHDGGIFLEAIAAANKKSPVTVIALKSCKAAFFEIERVVGTCGKSCSHHTQLTRNLLENIARKNLYLNSRIDVLTQKTLRDKIMLFLKSESQKSGKKIFTVSFNREELSEFLFVNRSALSRELSLMRDEGIIDYDRNSFKISF